MRSPLAGLGDTTFSEREPAAPTDDVDFADDADLPRNPEFLDYQATGGRPVLESLSSFEDLGGSSPAPRPGIISEVNGETIRLLHPGGLKLVEDYWQTLEPRGPDSRHPE